MTDGESFFVAHDTGHGAVIVVGGDLDTVVNLGDDEQTKAGTDAWHSRCSLKSTCGARARWLDF